MFKPGKRSLAFTAVLCSTAAVLGACSTKESAAERAANDAQARVTVVLTAKGFTVSGVLRPGGVLEARNDDTQMHSMLLARVHDGKTVKDFSKALESDDEGAVDKVVTPVGAPSMYLPPGNSVSAVATGLRPGTYVLADVQPAEGGDGTPNMIVNGPGVLRVAGDSVAAPSGDSAYQVTKGAPISGAARLSAGRHVFTVSGMDKEAELGLFRLKAGETFDAVNAGIAAIFDANEGHGLTVAGAGRRIADHVLGWIEPPHDGSPLIVGVDLQPGTYVLVAEDVDADEKSPAVTEKLVLTVA